MSFRILCLTHLLPFHAALDSQTNSFTLTPEDHHHKALYAALRTLPPASLMHIGTLPVYAASSSSKHMIDLSPCQTTALQNLLAKHNCLLVPTSRDTWEGHYEGYCKRNLWPLLHYSLWEHATDGRQELKDWQDYELLNELFVQRVCEIYQPGDYIWIHDYHLMISPSLLRQKFPSAPIAFFLHAPFPTSEIFRCLPKRRDILEGVLGANVVAFQNYSFARHFVSSCTRVIGLESTSQGVEYQGSSVTVAIAPVGINVEEIESICLSQDFEQRVLQVKEIYKDVKVILGVDRLDRASGVIQKLQGFKRFLTSYPLLRDKVVLVLFTIPARNSEALQKLQHDMANLITEINSNFGRLDFFPVHHTSREFSGEDLHTLMSISDVALVASTRDGLNALTHEWVICQETGRQQKEFEAEGVLVFSEFCAAASSLSGSLLFNPWDPQSVADALHNALTLSATEKHLKFQQLSDHVHTYTAASWAQQCLNDLKNTVERCVSSETLPLNKNQLYKAWKNAELMEKQRLLIFDYDGTLTPIRNLPHEASPSEEMLENLLMLCEDPRNEVWVVSGRDQETLSAWLGHLPNLGLSAEHGCFMKFPKEKEWMDLTEGFEMAWQEEVLEIFSYYTERTPGSFIEKKRCAISWHYRLADPDYGFFQAKECQNHLEEALLCKRPVEIIVGKKVLEVRPVGLNKGGVVQRLSTARPEIGLIWCCGDDKTDEDMFKVLHRLARDSAMDIFCVGIGDKSKKTMAEFYLERPEVLIQVMKLLNSKEVEITVSPTARQMSHRCIVDMGEPEEEEEITSRIDGKNKLKMVKWLKKWL